MAAIAALIICTVLFLAVKEQQDHQSGIIVLLIAFLVFEQPLAVLICLIFFGLTLVLP